MTTLVTSTQLAERLPYSRRHITDYLKDRVFFEGEHYVRLPGARKVLYIWEAIEADLQGGWAPKGIPMANGGICHG